MIAKFSNIDGKVIVNGVEITDSESWKKIIDSIKELQQENENLNKKLNEAIHKATEFESETYELKSQQQEFIKYLKNINSFETIGNILSKYKEIIGGEINEENND